MKTIKSLKPLHHLQLIESFRSQVDLVKSSTTHTDIAFYNSLIILILNNPGSDSVLLPAPFSRTGKTETIELMDEWFEVTHAVEN